MHISLSTALFKTAVQPLRFVTFQVKRYASQIFENYICFKFFQIVRNVKMLEGVTIAESKAQKDEYVLEGIDVDNVSQSGMFYLRRVIHYISDVFNQRHQFKVLAEYGTKTFVNSWMVSMCQKNRLQNRNNSLFFLISMIYASCFPDNYALQKIYCI